jgi:seryl-tRNA synthetase
MNDLTLEINRRHQKNTDTIQSIMKTFYHNLKDQLYSKKNENYHLVRELQQLQRDKKQLQQEVDFCSRRINELETVVGLKAKNDDREMKEKSKNKFN